MLRITSRRGLHHQGRVRPPRRRHRGPRATRRPLDPRIRRAHRTHTRAPSLAEPRWYKAETRKSGEARPSSCCEQYRPLGAAGHGPGTRTGHRTPAKAARGEWKPVRAAARASGAHRHNHTYAARRRRAWRNTHARTRLANARAIMSLVASRTHVARNRPHTEAASNARHHCGARKGGTCHRCGRQPYRKGAGPSTISPGVACAAHALGRSVPPATIPQAHCALGRIAARPSTMPPTERGGELAGKAKARSAPAHEARGGRALRHVALGALPQVRARPHTPPTET